MESGSAGKSTSAHLWWVLVVRVASPYLSQVPEAGPPNLVLNRVSCCSMSSGPHMLISHGRENHRPVEFRDPFRTHDEAFYMKYTVILQRVAGANSCFTTTLKFCDERSIERGCMYVCIVYINNNAQIYRHDRLDKVVLYTTHKPAKTTTPCPMPTCHENREPKK